MGLSIFCLAASTAAEPLLILPADVRIEQADGSGFGSKSGFDLYVRKKKGMESILLTETTKDPNGKADNYAYRATEWNSVNGGEKRVLNGRVLDSPSAKFSLVDSTAEDDPVFGKSFHIYIPPEIVFGYSWSRSGTVRIGLGTFINIRAFSKKYADYSGRFGDNPFMFDLGERAVPKPAVSAGTVPAAVRTPAAPPAAPAAPAEPEIKEVPVLTDDYSPDASEKFHEISDFMIYSKGPDSLTNDIMTSLRKIDPKTAADVVFTIDTTGSMKDDITRLRREWIPRLEEGLKEFGSLRLGLLLYRDYGESGYDYKDIPVKFYDFTSDVKVFEKNLNSFTINGNEGGDIPEAVYEGLYGAIAFYTWNPGAVRKVILIGDAGPHPVPRGSKKYTKALVQQLAAAKNITIDAIILPDDKARRGR